MYTEYIPSKLYKRHNYINLCLQIKKKDNRVF